VPVAQWGGAAPDASAGHDDRDRADGQRGRADGESVERRLDSGDAGRIAVGAHGAHGAHH